MKRNATLVGLALAAAPLACTGIEPDLKSLMQQTNAAAGVQEWHQGPAVEIAETGPARFTRTLHEGFDRKRAMELVRFIDGHYRAPANRGYDAVLERLEKTLREHGFGGDDDRLQLGYLEVANLEHAWTPVSAELTLEVPGVEPRVLHAFDEPEDVDRVMLPVNAPACDIVAEVALRLDDLKKGMILVTNVSTAQVMTRARNRGAAAVISSSLYPFNEDLSDANRHLDAIQYHTQPPGEDMPTAQISPRTQEIIEAAVERAAKRGVKVSLRFKADVLIEPRPLRTLMAVIYGEELPTEAVAMVSHVQEPGANDNASGVAGLVEGAISLADALAEERLPWPKRTLVFLWGDEFRQSQSWLEQTDLECVVGISSDMTGQSKDTGAMALLERNYDPGALKVYEPDFHTPWGAGQVDPREIFPNGLAVIARCAMIDVAMFEGGEKPWPTADHPWEGGSDHDIFIRRKIPAVLFWHFTDFAYHTSLDRMKYVDADEMRRTGVALLSTGLAVATAGPEDLARYVRSLERERQRRVDVATERGDAEQVERWEDWCKGTRIWLRNLCLGLDEPIPGGK